MYLNFIDVDSCATRDIRFRQSLKNLDIFSLNFQPSIEHLLQQLHLLPVLLLVPGRGTHAPPVSPSSLASSRQWPLSRARPAATASVQLNLETADARVRGEVHGKAAGVDDAVVRNNVGFLLVRVVLVEFPYYLDII